MTKKKTSRKAAPDANIRAIEQAIFDAWFSKDSGFVRPKSIRAKETGALFQAILPELTANVGGEDKEQDACEVLTSLDALVNDLERVRAVLRSTTN